MRICTNKYKQITVSSLYVPPPDIITPLRNIRHIHNKLITTPIPIRDVNAYSCTAVHRRTLTFNIINDFNHITLNTDTATRVPSTTHQQTLSLAMTFVTSTAYNATNSLIVKTTLTNIILLKQALYFEDKKVIA